jgi:hypothetical protein
MENWGDPWADNADNAKSSPTKTEVTSPLPPAFAPAPALLNGFLDDAGWGNEDESFGDWSAAPAAEEGLPKKTSMNESYAAPAFEHTSDGPQWGTDVTPGQQAVSGDGDWAEVASNVSSDEEQVASKTSTSSATVQDERTGEGPKDTSAHVRGDDESSTRASTSPSDTSHNDAPAESPRTSYEEERGAAKAVGDVDIHHDTPPALAPAASGTEPPASASSEDEDDEDVVNDTSSTKEDEGGEECMLDEKSRAAVKPSRSAEDIPEPAPTVSRNVSTFAVDSELLHELFASPKDVQDLEDAPDDPIYSTSARKAWYRLTRKQTMREFKNGGDDDNYIRVTWANSNVRSEVNTIIGRWAREDRMSGRGPGARASFYWDTPAPVDVRPSKLRHASQPVSSASASLRDSVPPLATNAPAAFGWSSPSVAVDPWQQNTPGIRSVSSPIAPIQSHAAQVQIAQVQIAQPRGPSMDLASRKSDPASGMQTLTASGETRAVSSLNAPPPIQNNDTSSSDPWTELDAFESSPAANAQPVNAPEDDDDEWGEMVSTPTVARFPTTAIDQPSDTVASFAIPSTPPQSKTTSYPDESPEMMHAAPIVRLRSTISPTSALFKANSFVPLSVEKGPIGPGLLKSSKRVASATATKPVDKLSTLHEPAPEILPPLAAPDVFSDWQASVPDAPVEEKPLGAARPAAALSPAQDVIWPSVATPDVFSEWQTSVPKAHTEENPLDAALLAVAPAPVQEVDWPSVGTPDVFSEWQTSAPDAPVEEKVDPVDTPYATVAPSIVQDVGRPSTPPPQADEAGTSNIDAWADADFSFFEASAPVKTPPKTKRDPSDPFSVFESPARSVSSASSAKTFTRSPPRKVTPPIVQPLTGATSAAQRRKNEEDQIIHDILGGLPDLSYMLRR